MGLNDFSWILELQIVSQLLAGISMATKHLSNVNNEDI
jgi:hypothetical protein